MHPGLGKVKTPVANPLSRRYEWVPRLPGSISLTLAIASPAPAPGTGYKTELSEGNLSEAETHFGVSVTKCRAKSLKIYTPGYRTPKYKYICNSELAYLFWYNKNINQFIKC